MVRSFLNKYVFDYGLVLKEDPTFEKFIEYEQEGIELEEPARRIGAVMTQDQADNLSIMRGDTEEEKEVIDFVHDKNDEKKTDWDAVGDNSNWHGKDVPHSLPVVRLKPEYEDPPNPDYDPSIPQLLPPNRFLKEGSEIWMGEDTFYRFQRYDNRDDSPYISTISRYCYSYKPPFIRSISSTYWFDRSKNTMAERKTTLKSFVYNMETRQIYYIKRKKASTKKNSRLQTSVVKIFNLLPEASWNETGNPDRLKNKFLNSITQAVIKDIGEVVIPKPRRDVQPRLTGRRVVIPEPQRAALSHSTSQRMELAVVLLQHRVGQPIHWLNHLFISNLWSIMSDVHFYDKVEFDALRAAGTVKEERGSYKEHEKKEKAFRKSSRRNTVGKLIPKLKKSNHMRTAAKAVFGKYYSKFFVKLLNIVEVDREFLSTWIACAHKGIIDKDLYHWFIQSVNNNNVELVKQIIRIITPMFHSLLVGRSETETISRAKSYIKICKRLYTENKLGSLPAWYIWNDTCDMASQLNIRIRPNKLADAVDIRVIHDKLTAIIRRDISIINKYKDIVFDEFISPDKDYNGFYFIQLRTAEDLTQEGIVMHHCVGGYASRCAEGRSIIFSMRKNDKSYVTIELNPSGNHEIVQRYTLHDITVTGGKALNLINGWHSDCVALHAKDTETYYDRCKKKVDKSIQEARDNTLNGLLEGGILENAAAV